MKRVIHGNIHQATRLELNKLSNKNISEEIEANPALKEFLNDFVNYTKEEKQTPNAKSLRVFTKKYKETKQHLPIHAKQLKSKTVLYLKALNSQGKFDNGENS